MKVVTNLLGRRARVFYLDPEVSSDQMRRGYVGVVRFVAVAEGAALSIGLELEEACSHPFLASYLPAGTMLFLRDRGVGLVSSIAMELLPGRPAVPR